MYKKEAIKLLEKAPRSKTERSKLSSFMTQSEVVEEVKNWVENLNPESKIKGIFLKRVWQVAKNQRRPRYEK